MSSDTRARASSPYLRKKSVDQMIADSAEHGDAEGHGGSALSRSIGTFQLMMFGVGATIGTGIFFVLAEAVPEAGPAVIVSFVFAGIVAGLTALCYAEVACGRPGLRVVVLLRLCLPRRAAGDHRGWLPDPRVRRRPARPSRRLGAVLQRAARQPVRLPASPTRCRNGLRPRSAA